MLFPCKIRYYNVVFCIFYSTYLCFFLARSIIIIYYSASQSLTLFCFHSLANEMEERSAGALSDPSRYLANPVNSFLLIKRLTTDWYEAVDRLLENKNTPSAGQFNK